MKGDIVRGICARVERKLDGKGRLNLPGDFREAAGFEPDDRVDITLAEINGQKAIIITRKEAKERYG